MGVHHPFIALPLTCKAYPIAILLHDHCAIYAPPPTPPFYATHHTILAMAISYTGQARPPLRFDDCCDSAAELHIDSDEIVGLLDLSRLVLDAAL